MGSCEDECRLPLILSPGLDSGSRPLVSSDLADPNSVEEEYRRIDWNMELECRRLKNSEAELFLRVFSISFSFDVAIWMELWQSLSMAITSQYSVLSSNHGGPVTLLPLSCVLFLFVELHTLTNEYCISTSR